MTHPDDVALDAGLAARLFAGEIGEYSVEQRIATGGGRYEATAVTTTAVGAGRPSYALAVLQALNRPRVRAARSVKAAPC
jgi:hypothetical protein